MASRLLLRHEEQYNLRGVMQLADVGTDWRKVWPRHILGRCWECNRAFVWRPRKGLRLADNVVCPHCNDGYLQQTKAAYSGLWYYWEPYRNAMHSWPLRP